eukprot:GCRY01003392.1.p1 GENE.GCRY01003392.1~~GCRY01003392.1.p1  ORF type:complete len:513 (+),score=145.36 GCRY01003392.1:176-1714(+)
MDAEYDEHSPLIPDIESNQGVINSGDDVILSEKIVASVNPTSTPLKIKFLPFLYCTILAGACLASPILKEEAAQRCLAILVFIGGLWATEAIPLFATALLVPLPAVMLHVLLDDEKKHIDASDSAKQLTETFFDPVVMLFLGGFTIARALDVYGINKQLAYFVLKRAGTKPTTVLLSMMFLGLFLSMWISNVAAAVICVTVVKPILDQCKPDCTYPKAMLLGIAYACNMGGMTTVISSPQNAIAVSAVSTATNGAQKISFPSWMMLSMPVSLVLIVVTFLWLWWFFKPAIKVIPEQQQEERRFTGVHYFILSITVVTVALWCFEDAINSVVGNIGIIALLPVVCFYGSGILTQKDFDTLPWNVLILMGGGMALGLCIKSSQLLNIITDKLGNVLEGQSAWVVLLCFVALVSIVGNIISSTVAAIIISPVIAQLGLQVHHCKMLVVLSVIQASGSMALPVSSFPNANSFSALTPSGGRFLTGLDYVKTGTAVTLFSMAANMSIGFAIAVLVGW